LLQEFHRYGIVISHIRRPVPEEKEN